MIHNKLRRLENDHDLGHWAVAKNAMVDGEVGGLFALAQMLQGAAGG